MFVVVPLVVVLLGSGSWLVIVGDDIGVRG